MTTMSADPAVDPRSGGHLGAWRALAAVPAIIGSLLLLLVLFGGLGPWEGVVLLGWLASGAMLMSRFGERLAVRAGARFRRPTKTQATLLKPVWRSALGRCGLDPADVDLYVQHGSAPNAYATGRRSIAITTGALAEFHARRLDEESLVAVVVHELGHLAARSTQFVPLTMWLAAPWRFGSRLVIGIAMATVGRRQPKRLLAGVVTAGVVIAVAHSVQRQQWGAVSVLCALALCAVACPLADAAVSRHSEYAADRFAARHGLGPQLVTALLAMDRAAPAQSDGWTKRVLSGHPSLEPRLRSLAELGTVLGAASAAIEVGPVANGQPACRGRAVEAGQRVA